MWPFDIPYPPLTTLPVRGYDMLRMVSTRLNIATTFPFVPKMFKPFETRLPFSLAHARRRYLFYVVRML